MTTALAPRPCEVATSASASRHSQIRTIDRTALSDTIIASLTAGGTTVDARWEHQDCALFRDVLYIAQILIPTHIVKHADGAITIRPNALGAVAKYADAQVQCAPHGERGALLRFSTTVRAHEQRLKVMGIMNHHEAERLWQRAAALATVGHGAHMTTIHAGNGTMVTGTTCGAVVRCPGVRLGTRNFLENLSTCMPDGVARRGDRQFAIEARALPVVAEYARNNAVAIQPAPAYAGRMLIAMSNALQRHAQNLSFVGAA
jgi:hypothetical protein